MFFIFSNIDKVARIDIINTVVNTINILSDSVIRFGDDYNYIIMTIRYNNDYKYIIINDYNCSTINFFLSGFSIFFSQGSLISKLSRPAFLFPSRPEIIFMPAFILKESETNLQVKSLLYFN